MIRVWENLGEEVGGVNKVLVVGPRKVYSKCTKFRAKVQVNHFNSRGKLTFLPQRFSTVCCM